MLLMPPESRISAANPTHRKQARSHGTSKREVTTDNEAKLIPTALPGLCFALNQSSASCIGGSGWLNLTPIHFKDIP